MFHFGNTPLEVNKSIMVQTALYNIYIFLCQSESEFSNGSIHAFTPQVCASLVIKILKNDYNKTKQSQPFEQKGENHNVCIFRPL